MWCLKRDEAWKRVWLPNLTAFIKEPYPGWQGTANVFKTCKDNKAHIDGVDIP